MSFPSLARQIALSFFFDGGRGEKCTEKCAPPSLSHPLSGQALKVCFSRLGIDIDWDRLCSPPPPQWGAADAKVKVPSDENTELKRSPLNAWSRSV